MSSAMPGPANTVKPSQWFSRKALKQPSRVRFPDQRPVPHATCAAASGNAQVKQPGQAHYACIRASPDAQVHSVKRHDGRHIPAPSVMAEVFMPIFRSSSRSTMAYSVS
jgi:hypothetical protein